MGTDIHLFVEKLVNGKWEELVGPYDGDWSRFHVDNYDDYKGAIDPTSRDYDVFAFLADVRNGTGFAGVYRHDRIEPQFADRGFPMDSSYKDPEETDEGDLNGIWLGDHSFTYASLEELLDAPWDMEFHSGGVVNEEEFKTWKEKGVPDGWAGDVSGSAVVVYDDPDEYEVLSVFGMLGIHDYCRVYWTWKPLEDCEFYKWCKEILLPLADGHPENIRVLMGFDN